MKNLDFELELLLTSRGKLAETMESLSEEKLLRILPPFNNNVLWHIGHCVASQQRLIYMRSGLPMYVSDEYLEFFQKGTSPKNWTKTPDLAEVKKSLLKTVEQLKEDLKKDIFKQYDPLKSAMGFMIKNHSDALTYSNFHEAEHTGNLKYLIKLIG